MACVDPSETQNVVSNCLPMIHPFRAEDWDLANPLQTCSLLVERRGDALCLDFMHDGKLFAQSKMELNGEKGFDLARWFEQTVDSSRYFALKIQGAGGREATIGFGFRDRDEATDLRESLQHYKKSLTREEAAKSLTGSFSIPKMEDGDKIHVNLAGKSPSKRKSKPNTSSGSSPFLLKKPPPPAENDQASKEKDAVERMDFSMSQVNLDAPKADDDSDNSGRAVYAGEDGDDDWDDTEFVSAN